MNRFDTLVRVLSEKRPANACYIVNCENTTSVAVRGLQSGDVRFYCERCAEELLTDFNTLFELVKQ